MTAERERFRYVVTFPEYVVTFPAPAGSVRETYYGPLWPPPLAIAYQRRRWRLLTASVLSDADMRILRRAGRAPVRTARYLGHTSVAPPLACGHPLALDDRCTVCTPIPCAACPHPAHFGACASASATYDYLLDTAACVCDTSIESS